MQVTVSDSLLIQTMMLGHGWRQFLLGMLIDNHFSALKIIGDTMYLWRIELNREYVY